MFESTKICPKYHPKVTRMGGRGGTGTEWGPKSIQDPSGEQTLYQFRDHFGITLNRKNWSFSCVFSERPGFATLDAIGRAHGRKAVPNASKKVLKRHHFEVRVDFWKWWFYLGKTIIFELPEVPGDDLETISEMKAAQRPLERCLSFQFCRFCQIFEILRVPLGGHLGSKIW